MPDRIQVIIAVPRDGALPVDVQGVGSRRRAIELMQEIATVDENTVRFKGASEDCIATFGDHVVSTWQHNLLAIKFEANGKALGGVVGPVVHKDRDTRVYSQAAVVRDEFAS
jgi:hypothetical protein